MALGVAFRTQGGDASHTHDSRVNAVAQIDIKPPWLSEQGFIARAAAAVAVAGSFLLGRRLHFHDHAPQQFARR